MEQATGKKRTLLFSYKFAEKVSGINLQCVQRLDGKERTVNNGTFQEG